MVALALAAGIAMAGATSGGQPPLPCGPVTACPTSTTSTSSSSSTTTTGGAPARADPGAQYDGRSEDFGYLASIVVNGQGNGLKSFVFGFKHGTCSDGGHYGSGVGGSGRDATIDAQGRLVESAFYPRAFWFNRHRRRVKGHERISFALQFNADQVTGSLRDEFDSRGLHCSSGPVSFSAFRDGSPNAPLKTSTIETGSYTGSTVFIGKDDTYGRSVVHVFLPLRVVASLSIGWQASCANGYTYGETSRFRDLPLEGDRFGAAGHDFLPRNKHGLYARDRYRLSGSFLNNGIYRDVVNWHYSITIYRRGRRVGRCTTHSLRYVGVGPPYQQ